MYEKLEKWAAKHNMQFKVENDDGYRVYVWMCDAVDGYCGAECVCIHTQPEDEYYLEPTWLGYRFRLKKNEQFIAKFIRNGIFEDTHDEWLGGHEPEPQFMMPRWYHCTPITWNGIKGTAYYLEKQPTEANEQEIIDAGCELLWVSPYYAPEIKRRVVFVPKGVTFADATIYGTNWYGKETIHPVRVVKTGRVVKTTSKQEVYV